MANKEEIEIQGETALVMAQSTMQQTLNISGLKLSILYDRGIKNIDDGKLSELFMGHYDLTVKEMGRFIAACGYELKFGVTKQKKTHDRRTHCISTEGDVVEKHVEKVRKDKK